MIDISRESCTSAWKDFETINSELYGFNPAMMEKPQIVVINKIDLPVTRERMQKETDVFHAKGIKAFTISAATGEGEKELIWEIVRNLKTYKEKVS
jgi:GTP-binding protein